MFSIGGTFLQNNKIINAKGFSKRIVKCLVAELTHFHVQSA